MEAKAIIKNVGVSQKKTMIPADIVRGMDVELAVATLKYMNKGAALHVRKAIESAAANAKNNYSMNEAALYVKEVMINKGLVYKRMKTASKGGYKPFIRPTSNITVVVAEREGVVAKSSKKPAKKVAKVKKVVKEAAEK